MWPCSGTVNAVRGIRNPPSLIEGTATYAKASGTLRNFATALLMLLTLAPTAEGANQYGNQERADAASQMIVLGVQQGISTLPPTSGQAFTYDFNAELGTFLQSEQLGPTVLRSPQTIGAKRLSLRFATSYFDLSNTFNPITYLATGSAPLPPQGAYTRFGMSADAKVVLLNFAATYGLTDRLEATMNIPVTVVDASASQTSLGSPLLPPTATAAVPVPAGQNPDAVINKGLKIGALNYNTFSFNRLGANFNNGTSAGLGRVSVGVKGLLAANDWGELAASVEFFCNSPNQAQFAGSNSNSILPRLIGQIYAAKYLNIHADIGAEQDFQVDELSRFVWNTGVSIPIPNATFDFGVGGSKLDQGITWTPVTATGVDTNGNPVTIKATNPNATQLGTDYIDFLFGTKVRLFDGFVLGGAVNVPITSDGFRAAAVGTVSIEYYFNALGA
jgi:hypothetical protein